MRCHEERQLTGCDFFARISLTHVGTVLQLQFFRLYRKILQNALKSNDLIPVLLNIIDNCRDDRSKCLCGADQLPTKVEDPTGVPALGPIDLAQEGLHKPHTILPETPRKASIAQETHTERKNFFAGPIVVGSHCRRACDHCVRARQLLRVYGRCGTPIRDLVPSLL